MADDIVIAKGIVEVETKYDGSTITRISHNAGQRAGRHFYEGFRRGSIRRFNKLWSVFFRPLNNLKKWLTRLRLPALLGAIVGAGLALVPTAAQLGAAVGAGAVPAFLSWATSIGIVRALLGRLDKSIESQLMKRIDGLSKGIKKIAVDTAKPGLNAFFREALQHAPILEKYVRDIARHVRDVGFSMAEVLDREANIRRIRTTLDGTARATGMWYSLLDEAVEVLLVIAAAGTPLFERFTRSMLKVGHTIHDWVLLKEETGELQRYLNNAYLTLEKFGRGGRDFLIGLFNIVSGGVFGTERVADSFERWGAAFRRWTENRENVEKVRDVIKWFVDHVGGFLRFAAAATAVQLALIGIQKIKGPIALFRTLMGLGPLGFLLFGIGTAIAAIGTSFVLAYTRLKPFRDGLGDLWNMLKTNLGPIFRDWGGWIRSTLLPALDDLAMDGLAQLRVHAEYLVRVIKDNQEGLKGLRPLILLIVQAAHFLGAVLIDEVIGAIGQTIEALGWLGRAITTGQRWFNNLKQWAGTAVDAVAEWFRLLPDRIMNFLKLLPGRLQRGIVVALEAMAVGAGYGLAKVVDFFVKLPGRIGRWITQTWKDALNRTTNWWNNIVKFIAMAPARVLVALTNFGPNILKRFNEGWSGARKNTGTWVGNIIRFITGVPGKVWGGLVQLKNRLVNRFAEGWAAATGTQKAKVVAVINHILGVPGRAFNALRALAGNLSRRAREAWDSFRSAAGGKVGAIIDWLTFVPRRMANALKRAPGIFLEVGRQTLQGLLAGVQKRIAEVGGLGSWFKANLVDPIVNAVKRFFGIKSPSKVFQGIGTNIVAGLWQGIARNNPVKMVTKLFGGMPQALGKLIEKGIVSIGNLPSKALKALGNVWGAIGRFFGGGGNLAKWAAQAVAITGVPVSWIPALIRRAIFESGGNPRAINLWDSNAARGTPSMGLMQTIGPTFEAYKLPGLNDIWNPVHNMVAAIRYILSRYGSIFRIDPPVRGYRQGGRLPENILGVGQRTGRGYMLHENETVMRRNQTIGHQGNVYQVLGPVNFIIDPKNVREFNDAVEMLSSIRPTVRMGPRPRAA